MVYTPRYINAVTIYTLRDHSIISNVYDKLANKTQVSNLKQRICVFRKSARFNFEDILFVDIMFVGTEILAFSTWYPRGVFQTGREENWPSGRNGKIKVEKITRELNQTQWKFELKIGESRKNCRLKVGGVGVEGIMTRNTEACALILLQFLHAVSARWGFE